MFTFDGLARTPWGSDEIAIGLFLFLFGGVAIALAGTQGRQLIMPLMTALVLRASVALWQRMTLFLPQGGADARGMERFAWNWADSGCLNTQTLDLGKSYVHSWIVSQFHACLGADRGPLIFQMINVLLGVLTIFLGALAVRRIWGRDAAVRAAWALALFPTLVLYSVVELRETWMIVFLMAGTYFVVRWYQERHQVYFALGVAAIMVSAIFHGGAIFGIFGLGVVVIVNLVNSVMRSTTTQRLPKIWLGAGMMVLAGSLFLILGVEQLRFSSIGDVTELGEQYETLDQRQGRTIRGTAEYPGFLRLEGASDLQIIALTPVRMAYLMFSPLPWDVRAPRHLIGLFDGMLYMAMFYLLWKYRAQWWHRRELRLLVFMLGAMVLVYAWGTGNFGTAMRHRAKLVGLLIVIAAGLLGRPRWRQRQLERLGGPPNPARRQKTATGRWPDPAPGRAGANPAPRAGG